MRFWLTFSSGTCKRYYRDCNTLRYLKETVECTSKQKALKSVLNPGGRALSSGITEVLEAESDDDDGSEHDTTGLRNINLRIVPRRKPIVSSSSSKPPDDAFATPNSDIKPVRPNLQYLDPLATFHKHNGTNMNRFPSVDKPPLDLYKLNQAVAAKGGFEFVCKNKMWAEVARELGYTGRIMSSLSTSLKNTYQKWLQPFEEWQKQSASAVESEKPTPPPADARIGSEFLPRTHLSEYELYQLHKKMKKTDTWRPSDTMVRRELAARRRGWENYQKAGAAAQARAGAFVDRGVNENPQLLSGSKAKRTKFAPKQKSQHDLEQSIETMILSPMLSAKDAAASADHVSEPQFVSQTRCTCGLAHDEGPMFRCEECLTWQHVECSHCQGDMPDYRLCTRCMHNRAIEWAGAASPKAWALELPGSIEADAQEDSPMNLLSEGTAVTDVDKSIEIIRAEDAQAAKQKSAEAAAQVAAQVRSLEGNDCGKKKVTMAEAEHHATISSHGYFSESADEVKTWTEEEKKQNLEDWFRIGAEAAQQLEQYKLDAKWNGQISRNKTKESDLLSDRNHS